MPPTRLNETDLLWTARDAAQAWAKRVIWDQLGIPQDSPDKPWMELLLLSVVAAAGGRMLQRQTISAARANGVSWRDMFPVMGLDRAADPGMAVFDLCLQLEGWTPASGWEHRYVNWRCASCDQHVQDSGPFEANPADNEKGHDGNCTRHIAEIGAYRASINDNDED